MVVGQSKRVHCLALVKREKSKWVAKKFVTFSEAWLCLIFDAISASFLHSDFSNHCTLEHWIYGKTLTHGIIQI